MGQERQQDHFPDLTEREKRAANELLENRRVVCPGCGTYNGLCTDHLSDLYERIADLEDNVSGLTSALTRSERKVAYLQRDANDKLRNHKKYNEAIKVLEAWRELCHPNAKEITGGERLRKVLARLDGGYEVEQLQKAALGYSLKPFVVNGRRCSHGTKDNWRAEAELVFRDPNHVDYGIRVADQHEQLTGVGVSDPDPVSSKPVAHSLSAFGKAAIRYVSRFGWQVFPCKANAKQPATRNGLLDACADPERIAGYWSKVPHANVAIRTGAESGIIVLDVDGEEGMESLCELEKQNGEMPKTFSVVTPSGGQHFYFKHPGVEIRNAAGIRPGLDIRGDGGYVLAYPSVVEGRSYEVDEIADMADMPQWLVDGLVRYQLKTAGKVDIRDYEKLIEDGMRQGTRNSLLLSIAGHWYTKGLAPGEICAMVRLVNKDRCNPPLPDNEVEKIVLSLCKMRERERHRGK